MGVLFDLIAADPVTLFSAAVWVVVWLLLVATLLAWVYRDADSRGSSAPGLWAVFAVGVLPIGFPAYLYWRRGREDPPTSPFPDTAGDRILVTMAIAGVSAYLLGSILAAPDPFSQVRYGAVMLVLTLPAAWLYVRANLDGSAPGAVDRS